MTSHGADENAPDTPDPQQRSWDAIVIGGGVAGLSAAQMLGRARRRTLVIDGGLPRNRYASHMHGVLGQDGTPPRELLATGRRELTRYGVTVESGEVTDLIDEGESLRVVRADGTVEQARAVLIASGIRDELPVIPGLAEQWGRGVLHCPYCHGYEVADLRLGVLATSPQSAHQLELVRQWSPSVTAFTHEIEPLDEGLRHRLIARGVRIVDSAVTRVDGDDTGLQRVVTADGEEHPLDALFTAPTTVVDLAYAKRLRLERTDQPGSPVHVDPLGASSHARVWAVGNAVAPYGNVPVTMASGAMAGAAINVALVTEDATAAVARRSRERAQKWEERYASSDQVWSGRVNASFAEVITDIAPGRALELGCGEGADALYLAERGWMVTALDISPTAVARARAEAARRGLSNSVSFHAASGVSELADERFDLVSAAFLHSWETDFPRLALLREAAEHVAEGGLLLVISHPSSPENAHEDHAHAPRLLPPREELAALALPPEEWETLAAELRPRPTTPEVLDGVILLRRISLG